MKVLLLILLIYFLLGAVLVNRINRKRAQPAMTRNAWTKYLLYLVVVSLVISIMWKGFFFYCAVAMTAIGLFEMVLAWRQAPGRPTGLLVGGLLIYALIATGFVFFSRIDEQSQFPIVLYIFVVIFDGFSQLSGQLFGHTKMVPVVSPAKTWEGFRGGLIMILITGVLYGYSEMDWKPDGYVLFFIPLLLGLVLLAISALVGDLLASLFKRKCGIKDYGRWIPGHGGLLDRFDSFIFVGAILFGLTKIIPLLFGKVAIFD